MHWMKYVAILFVMILTGCASAPPAHDYSAFRSANPTSVLVMPPVNNSVEVVAPYSVMAQIATPIAESGYYVFPVALVQQTFRTNGMTEAADIHAIPFSKVHEIFGADTALYLTIDKYGTSYAVLSSDTVVTISATLVDLRSGAVLWKDKATASSAETKGNSGGGLVGMLIEAAMTQIIDTITDRGFDIAAISANRLLYAESYNGFLYGPRSPKYGQPVLSEKKK